MGSFDFAYYAGNFQVSFLIMNVIAGFYFIATRFVAWSSLSEATTMEKQGSRLLIFCMAISFINAVEIDNGENFLGWLSVMGLEFFMGALIGVISDKFYKIA